MTTTYMGQLFLMSLYFTVLDTIPVPVNFTILSHNFKHILQWSPGINSPPQTVFNLNQSCGNRKPEHLQLNIRNTAVDVSETFKDIYTSCTFFLWASIDNMTSSIVNKSITPYEDTIIGPPIIFMSGCGDCLNISISLPSESMKIDHLHPFYNSVSFDISWKKSGQKEANQISISGKQYVLQNLQPGEQYCVRVFPQIISNLNTHPSAWQCGYTSKEEPRGMFYLMSWSLGAAVSGLGLLLLALSLVYTGFICKPPLPKSLINTTEAYHLIPEQTLFESVWTDSQLIWASKSHPTKNNNQMNVQEDAENKQHEDEENYLNEADTEDEEEDEGNCNNMDCVIDNSGRETNNSEEKAIVSFLTLHNSSGICHTKASSMEQIHHDKFEFKKEFILDMSEDRKSHLEENNSVLESKGNQDRSGHVSGNINLFSVTLSALGSEDDLDEEEACKPLLPKSVVSEVQELSTSHISLLEKQKRSQQLCASIQREIKTDNQMQMECKDTSEEHTERCVCSDLDMGSEYETTSGYMINHTGNMHEHNSSLSEGTDCDTDYITR